MATTGLYKMRDGSNSATNCFPARSVLRSNKEGSGRWVLARRATPRAWPEKETTGETPQQRRKPPEENNEDKILDESFLMKHHGLKNPSDLCSANISGQNLVSAKEDDLEKFDCITFINAAENLLTLGQTPLLTRLLQNNLGNKLLCQKSLAVGRRPFSIPLKASRKVTSHLPKVTKQPLMLEAPAKTFLWKQVPAAVEAPRDAAPPSPALPLLPVSSVTPDDNRGSALEEEEGDSRPPPGSAEEDVASFFMTQVEDVSRPLLRPTAEGRLEKRSEQSREGSSQVVPERYKGYEELLGGDTDLDFIESVGIQKNVQALYYILKHPLLYRDPKPRLDSIQKPYVPRRKHGRMPSPPAQKTRAEILEGILMAMRNTSTITEVPLAPLLQERKSNPKLYRQARRLMEEFQEVFQIPSATVGEEMAKPSDEGHEATSEQGSPKQLQLPGKRAAKKLPKVQSGVEQSIPDPYG